MQKFRTVLHILAKKYIFGDVVRVLLVRVRVLKNKDSSPTRIHRRIFSWRITKLTSVRGRNCSWYSGGIWKL